MNDLENLEQELNASLAALAASDKPCGCHDKQAAASDDSPFAEFMGADDIASELELALGALGGSELSSDEALEFAMASATPSVGLEDLVALAQQYPGLKITFSM